MFNFLRKVDNSQPIFFPDISSEKLKILKTIKKNHSPIFLISSQIIRDRLRSLDHFHIAYSFKTNYNLARSAILDRKKITAEVVSGREYLLAKKLGYQHLIYNGPYKSKSSLKLAINDKNTLIHIDGYSQLAEFSHLNKHSKKFGLRFNPQVTHSRFGFTRSEILSISGKYQHLVNALHVHLGSDIDNPNTYLQAVLRTNQLIEQLVLLGVELDYIDFGGGFPSHGRPPFSKKTWNPKPISTYLSEIRKLNIKNIYLEPGRYLVDDATFFITKVIETKEHSGQFQILCNASINMLPLTNYRPQIVKSFSFNLNEYPFEKNESIIFGATCQESDKLHQGYISHCHPGDYLIFYCTGAYNQSMESNFIFSKPKTRLL